MNPVVSLYPVGRQNRRDKVDEGDLRQVLIRENFAVIGQAEEARKNKKVPGSDRLNSSDVGSYPFVWGTRYYTKLNFRKTFAYNQGDGYLYHISDAGVTSQILGVFSKLAYPCSEVMRVSDVDVLYFSEGIDPGIYSYDGNAANVFSLESSVALTPVGMVSHLDRMWVFEEDSEDLFFSANLDPTNFTDSTDSGLITIGPRRGSKIQQIIVDNETIYVFKTDSIWVVEGRTPSEFSVREVHPSLGLAARHSLQKVESGMMFLGSDFEFYSFGGTQESTKLMTYDLAIGGDLTKDLIPIINRDRMAQVKSIYHNKIYRCSIVETGETVPKLEYCFSTINETDWFTRNNNVSCYILWDRFPDKQELITGRSDAGFLMQQYRGLNWDNQATTPTMPIKLETKFIKDTDDPINSRFKRAWLDCEVLGAEPIDIKYQIDTRNADSDAITDTWPIQGEYKSPTNFIRINSQRSITSRVNLKHASGKGQSIGFKIDQDRTNIDLSFSKINIEVIRRNRKRSQKVGI